MKRLLTFAFSVLVFGTGFISAQDGYLVTFPTIPSFPENSYINYVKEDIHHTQEHSNCLKASPVVDSPACALIIGAGTIGMEAVVAATHVLPEGSTIAIIQNNIDEPQKLITLFQTEIERGHLYQWIVSEKIEIGQLDTLTDFIVYHKEQLKNTCLYFHTADRAERFVPDSLPYEAVISQIVRRASVVHINNLLEKIVDEQRTLIKVLVSSECAQDRSRYKIPNLGPYQVGKIVGDELFLQGTHRDNSISAILYSGPMDTQGQVKARTQEYKLLSERGEMKTASGIEEYVDHHRGVVDIDPMESVGVMLNIFFDQYREGIATLGNKYRCYGASVNPDLGHGVNKLEQIETTEFMWPTLEK